MAGDRLALARLLTAVENRTPRRRGRAAPAVPGRRARRTSSGITGPPGSGKSTLVAALIGVVRAAGRAVAVVAVDPSSPITGGALLGDRVRMQSYAGDPDVFIRSMASRGHAGGLASTTTAAAAVLDAAGLRPRAHRDRRDRPERGRGRGRGRHDGRPRGARDGRRGPGDQGRPARGRGPRRRQQGRQARGAADRGPAAGDARPDRRPDARPARIGRHRSAPRSWSRPPRPARACRSCSAALDRHRATGATAEGGGARLARAEAQVWAILGERLRASLVAPERRAATDAVLEEVAAHRLDPYAAADRLLADLRRSMTTHDDDRAAAVHPRIRSPVRGRPRVLHRRGRGAARSRHGSPPARSARMRPASASRSGRSPSRRSLLRPVVGWASDRFGRRPLLIGGGLMTVVALLFHLVATTLPAVRRRSVAARDRRGVLLRRRRRGDQRPGARRSGAARPSTTGRWRSTWVWRSGRSSGRPSSAGAGSRRSGSRPRRWRARPPS